MPEPQRPSVTATASGSLEQPPTENAAAAIPLTRGPCGDGPSGAERSDVLSTEAGRYRLGEEIGRGGMGSVRRGHDPALKRDLAVKVLRADHTARPEMVQRFFEEAQIAGQLQHPGVVPVHDLGTLPDGRPFFTMKIVQGRTLAELLRERANPADSLSHWLHIFEQVCQAMAYAHSRGVIHRDLKPSNVMVGAFGEVQVMDWGLAKVLGKDKRRPTETETESVFTLRKESGDVSQAGTVLGTPAYMPPEQARGEVENLDERADVFGLGAILCQILTGKPPYFAAEGQALLHQAMSGDLANAFARLDACGADAELIALARSCLAPDREGRPRHAGEVAARLRAYQTGVQERLRAAEAERVAAVARAEAEGRKRRAERRARRLLLGLACMTVAALLAGGGVWLWVANDRALRREDDARRQAEADREEAVRQALARSRDEAIRREVEEDLRAAVAKQGQGDWPEATNHLRHAEGRLADGGFPDLRDRIAAARRNLDLVALLNDIRFQKGTWTGDSVAFDSALNDYPRVLSAFGFDVLGGDPERTAEAIRRSPVREPLLAALDDWAFTRGVGADADRILDVAMRADADDRRNQFRDLWRHRKRSELVALAYEIDPGTLSPAALCGLGQALARQPEARVRLLRRAQARYSDDFWLVYELAIALQLAGIQSDEVVTCYRVALALQPRNGAVWNDLGALLNNQGKFTEAEAACREAIRLKHDMYQAHTNLGNALIGQGKHQEGEKAYRQAIALKPNDAVAHYNLGILMKKQGKFRDAEAAYGDAIRINPNYAEAHCNLGGVRNDQGKYQEAEAACREAIRLKPALFQAHSALGRALNGQRKYQDAEAACRQAIRIKPDSAEAHCNLGIALHGQAKYKEAETACRQAIRLKSELHQAHDVLGNALANQGRPREAEAAYREAIRIQPDDPVPHSNLALILNGQGKHREAEAAYRQTIRLKPDDAGFHYNLGRALAGQGKHREAEAAYREAIRLKPNYAEAHCNLGGQLRQQGRFAESLAAYVRGDELGSKQPGWRYPSERWVGTARRLLVLDARLPAVRKGDDAVASAAEGLEFMGLCRCKGLHSEAVRFAAEAFEKDRRLADNLGSGSRHQAALSAVLAGNGQGGDAADLDADARAQLRRQALTWLRADLNGWTRRLENGQPNDRALVERTVRTWQQHIDLSGVRDAEALAQLPYLERIAWQRFWADVDVLLEKAASP
jgi:serine/threonine-protein kinase